MIDATQARIHIIRPALTLVGLHSPAAEDLLLGTAAAESLMGTYVRQVGGGPAISWMQVEPATHADIWDSWLRYRNDLAKTVAALVPDAYWHSGSARPQHEALIGNLIYSTAIARIVYQRARPALPVVGDWTGMAGYWKTHYNTTAGAGTVEHYLDACKSCGVYSGHH